jgi:type III restriction enzyme
MTALTDEIDEAIAEWRNAGYPGTTEITSQLLNYWFETAHINDDGTPFEFWDCQREAIESLIYLHEVSGYRSLQDLYTSFGFDSPTSPSRDKWPRYCFGMATGSGKTFVMALAIVWQYCNSEFGESEDEYTSNFVLIAPNMIVLDRLREFEDTSLFGEWPFFVPKKWDREFDLQTVVRTRDVPKHSSGILHITNVQQFYDYTDEFDPKNPVESQLGPEPRQGEEFKSDADLFDLIARYDDVLVLNDEAHHAHPDTQWWDAIARLNEDLAGDNGGVTMQIDFTATPLFVESEGRKFPHIIHEYPLADAIDDGIIKRPRIASVKDAPSPVEDHFVRQRKFEIEAGLEVHENKKEELAPLGEKPVLFIMCDRNEHADEVGDYIVENAEYDQSQVLVIHTYKRKTRRGDRAGDIRRDELDRVREAAKNIDDNEYEIIVSVMMLKEGWDVRNVTTIVPLRAFESEILTEQTLGRGLRRMFPENDELQQEELLVVEHPSFRDIWEEKAAAGLPVDIDDENESPEIERNELVEVDEAKLEYDFSIPLLLGGISKEEQPDVSKLDVDRLEGYNFDYEAIEPPDPELVIEDLRDAEEIDRRKIHYDVLEQYRPYLEAVINAMINRTSGAVALQFPELVPPVRDYLEKKVFDREVDLSDSEVVGKLNDPSVRKRVINTMVEALRELTTTQDHTEVRGEHRLSDTTPLHTSKSFYKPEKSVFNRAPYDSKPELDFMRYLDGDPRVAAYAKILMKMPLQIRYYGDEGLKHYVPDFVVKDVDEDCYLVEVKGESYKDNPEVLTKAKAGLRWCERVREETGLSWEYKFIGADVLREFRSQPLERLLREADYNLEELLEDGA